MKITYLIVLLLWLFFGQYFFWNEDLASMETASRITTLLIAIGIYIYSNKKIRRYMILVISIALINLTNCNESLLLIGKIGKGNTNFIIIIATWVILMRPHKWFKSR